MALIYNGTTITGDYTVKYNGTELTKIIYNNQTVWEKNTQKTYRYKFEGLLVGTSSGIDGSYPSSTGVFRINSTYGAMWCIKTTSTDYTGYNTTFANCMNKTINSIKMYVYRANSQTFNTTANNSGWIYHVAPTAAGAKMLIKDATTLTNNGYTIVNTATPVPTNTGLVQVSLTSDQLKTCFKMTPFTISAAAGHSPAQISAGSYVTLGLRGLYSNTPQFTCKSNDATYGYVEIVATG